MFIPRFYHLSGTDLWQRCSFENLQINAGLEQVELASQKQLNHVAGKTRCVNPDQDELELLLQQQGGALLCPDSHNACATLTLLADPQSGLLYWQDNSLQIVLPEAIRLKHLAIDKPEINNPEIARPEKFAPQYDTQKAASITFDQAIDTPTIFRNPSMLSRDGAGCLWLLDRGRNRIEQLEVDAECLEQSRSFLTLLPPYDQVEAKISTLAACQWGMVIADRQHGRIWRRLAQGEWLEFSDTITQCLGCTDYTCLALAGHPQGHVVGIMRRSSIDADHTDNCDSCTEKPQFRLVYITDEAVWEIPLTGFETPLHLLQPEKDYVFIGEAGADCQRPSIHHFYSFRLLPQPEQEKVGFQAEQHWHLRYFDGCTLYSDAQHQVYGTTEVGGCRQLSALSPALINRAATGVVETYALDSGKIGCQWHRVFIDVCLPKTTAIRVYAQTSDVLPESHQRRDVQPAFGVSALQPEQYEEAVRLAWEQLPLAATGISPDNDWLPIGAMDHRPYQADIPLAAHNRPDITGEEPIDNTQQVLRLNQQDPLKTLEGLLKNGRGRYLWLKIVLQGDGKYSPALTAIRASYQRPSLLNHLPAYWQADPLATKEMEQVLALFEGHYTELMQHILQFRQLLDPRLCPEEALSWLAGFVNLSFDNRLQEPIRRRLLKEITTLYRQRGTVPGLERLCEILTGKQVKVIEQYRLRRRSLTLLGADEFNNRFARAVVGDGLQLGGEDLQQSGTTTTEGERSVDQQLLNEYQAIQDKRDEKRLAGERLCPAANIPAPFPQNPVLNFYRQYAHRFQVVVFAPRQQTVEALLNDAIEANKPAHTLHELCWQPSDFHVGRNTYVGLSTVIQSEDCPNQPTVTQEECS